MNGMRRQRLRNGVASGCVRHCCGAVTSRWQGRTAAHPSQLASEAPVGYAPVPKPGAPTMDAEPATPPAAGEPPPDDGLAGAVAQVAAALERLAAVDVSAADDRELLDAATALGRLADRHTGQTLRVIERIDARQAFALDAAVTTASWLRARLRTDPAPTTAQVHAARRLRDLPRLRAALQAGAVGWPHVHAITSAAVPGRIDALTQIEPALVDLARTAQPRHVRAAVRHLADAVDPDGSTAPPMTDTGPDPRRELRLRRGIDGLWNLDATLDILQGEALATALNALDSPDSPDVPTQHRRTPTQRRADALGTLARRVLDSANTPTVAGNKPHILLTIDLATLVTDDATQPRWSQPLMHTSGGEDQRDGNLSLADAADGGEQPDSARPLTPVRGSTETPLPPRLRFAGPVTPAIARRLATEAKVTAVLTMGPWRIANVGRTHRTLPAWLRGLLDAVHGHCRGPDCDRPIVWTEAHHQHPWSENGDTDLNATIPVCKAHHDLVTSGKWHVTFDPDTGNCTWTGRNGRTVRTHPPP